MKKYLIAGLITALFGFSASAERVETEKITISNDLVVVSNATVGSMTIGGEARTNWPSGGTAVDGTYPVIKLKLGEQWTDFEIKASTNNFTTDGVPGDDMVYYYISTGANSHSDDTNVFIYFTDDYQVDVRQWIKATNNTPIYDQLVNPGASVLNYVYVYPSHDCMKDWSVWMSKTNKNLVWSWVRIGPVDFETNAVGTQIWSPVRPDSWEVERTIP